MTPIRFQKIILGTLAIWDVECEMNFVEDGFLCFLEGSSYTVSITYEEQAFGPVWRIEKNGERERVYPSVGAMMRALSQIFLPTRQVGRVIFSR